MIVHSFFSSHGRFKPLEVEVKLTRGLPTLQVIGLPDQSMKESALRIKTALNSQGFQWPRAKQVVVNLRPTHLRKHSQGLELAIACALLWETEQIPKPKSEKFFVYGELSLEGEVKAPFDLEALRSHLSPKDLLFSASNGKLNHKGLISLNTLSDLAHPEISPDEKVHKFISPEKELPEIYFSQTQAQYLALSALTQSSTLLAGPPGSGKTTFAESLYHLLPKLNENEFFDLRSHHIQLGVDLKYRPLIQPHHSTPVMSLIGGGSELFPGELVKAHGGLLILDEFLLFPTRVIESLREPLISKRFSVSRRGKNLEWPAEFQFVATTNLCPCGKLGARKDFSCGYSIRRCRAVIEKLSGPMLDRFELIFLFENYQMNSENEPKVSLKMIQTQVEEARAFEKEAVFDPDSEIPLVLRVFESRRRELALKKIAKAMALLEGESKIGDKHWEEAFKLTQKPIEQFERLMR